MTDITAGATDQIIGATAFDQDGDKIGKIGQVYLDDSTGQPEWVTVSTGLFGTRESFVPLEAASFDGDRLTLPFDKAKVKDAPNIADDEHLSPEDESRLYDYYGIKASGLDRDYDASGADLKDHDIKDRDLAAHDKGTFAAGTGLTGHDKAGHDIGDAMTVSEERLKVGTESREAGRAKLRKHVVTEHQTVQVPVSHEEVTIEREPITDANRDTALTGKDLSDDEHTVTLHEERPVVSTETVPVERVRLGTETVTGTETISEDVRKERVDVDGDGIRDDLADRKEATSYDTTSDDLRRKEATSYDAGSNDDLRRKEATSYGTGSTDDDLRRKEASSYATPDDTIDRRI